MKHWRKIALLLGILTVYFVCFGLILGWTRLRTDWWPLDQSLDGPNLYASFVWLPIGAVGGWIASDIHKDRLTRHHDRMITSVAHLLGIEDDKVAEVLDATPADRSI